MRSKLALYVSVVDFAMANEIGIFFITSLWQEISRHGKVLHKLAGFCCAAKLFTNLTKAKNTSPWQDFFFKLFGCFYYPCFIFSHGFDPLFILPSCKNEKNSKGQQFTIIKTITMHLSLYMQSREFYIIFSK